MTDLSPIKKLPLLRDYDADSWQKFNAASEASRAIFSARGYKRIDTPIIELTELFLRKSGGELAAQLYSFTDPGGYEVSLRPEFTAPVIRHIIESGRIADLPLRLEYSGPVFRYPSPDAYDNGLSGSFTQTGAELIGIADPSADGEIIAMALDGLKVLGIDEPRLVIGHVGLIWDLLQPMTLSDRARLFLINCVGTLAAGGAERVRQQAAEMGLLPLVADVDPGNRSAATAPGSLPASMKIEALLTHSLGNSFSGSVGSRNPDDILARLALKIHSTDDPAAVNGALDLLAELAKIKDRPEEAFKRTRETMANAGQDSSPAGLIEDVIQAVIAEGIPESAITVDLGLAREVAYYTGSVFDLEGPEGEKLGGGGRYDGLVRALGSDTDTPALGFAYNTDAVLKVVEAAS
ncbi:MAG: ATP phosphoribosyltransferase regulatory subunit [Chloroflexi bacterium]|nr:ATP phosphoribosyltransferase regulatory subunit [Chloroflexota bacterium]